MAKEKKEKKEKKASAKHHGGSKGHVKKSGGKGASGKSMIKA